MKKRIIISYKKVVEYFKESHRLSPLAFWCEVVECILLVGSSAVFNIYSIRSSYVDICSIIYGMIFFMNY